VSTAAENRRNHNWEAGMKVQRRDFLLLVTLAAAAATPALGQAVTPAAGPAKSDTHTAASIPDFSGLWSHPYFPGFEPPASGPGPVTKRLRLGAGPQRGVSNPNQLVGDYTNPILKPQAAEAVKKHGEIELSVGAPTPMNQCWPEGVPFVFRDVGMQMLQQRDGITILYVLDHQRPQLCTQKSHRDRQARRVHIGASCTPIATEHLFDFFIGRQIAPSRACFDDLPFLFADVVVRAPLFHLADESRDLLLLVRRPAQHSVENFLKLISRHGAIIPQSTFVLPVSAIEASPVAAVGKVGGS
jgi:hypothetical protein